MIAGIKPKIISNSKSQTKTNAFKFKKSVVSLGIVKHNTNTQSSARKSYSAILISFKEILRKIRIKK